MSWNINAVGKPADLKAYLAGITYFPKPLTDMVGLLADVSPPSALLQLETYGHFDSATGGNVGKFELKTVTLVAAPPAPTLPTPPPTATPLADPQPSTPPPATV